MEDSYICLIYFNSLYEKIIIKVESQLKSYKHYLQTLLFMHDNKRL